MAAFGDWQATRVSPRDAIARHVARDLPAAARAEIAAVVYGAIRDQHRLRWALGPDCDLVDGVAHAAAIVLAQCVAGGALAPAAAAKSWHGFATSPLDFDAVLDVDERIEALPEPRQRFALRYSMPEWLAQQFHAEFGDAADRVAAALNRTPPRAIRVNRLAVPDRQTLARDLANAAVSTALCRFAPDGLVVVDDTALFELPSFRAGAFEQQDEGSQLVAQVVAPPPRGRVLDACAGSGGKALAIAANLANAGAVLAIDVHEPRVLALRQRARRAGAHNVQAAVVGADAWPESVAAFAAQADRILLDVPCSGTGSWRRRPEARWTLQPTDLESLLAVQRQLLDRAAAVLQPGARIVYATCSLWRAENEDQVANALARHPALELVLVREVLGGTAAGPISDPSGTYLSLRPDRHGTDGFFAAILRRRRCG